MFNGRHKKLSPNLLAVGDRGEPAMKLLAALAKPSPAPLQGTSSRWTRSSSSPFVGVDCSHPI